MNKEKRFSEELLCTVLFVGLAFGVVTGMAIYASAYPIFQSDNWAAWVQAIGSLIALFVVYAASRKQADAALKSVLTAHDLAMEAQRASVLAIAEAAHLYLEDYSSTIKSALNKAVVPEFGCEVALALSVSHIPSRMDELIEGMAAVDLSRLESPESVRAYLAFRQAFRVVKINADKCVDGPWGNPDLKRMLDEISDKDHQFKLVVQARAQLVNNLQKAIEYSELRFRDLVRSSE